MAERTGRSSGSDGPRWVVLRTAPEQLTAEIWCGLLENQGIPATLAPGDAVSFMGVSPVPCRVMVPDALVAAAEGVLDGEPWESEPVDESRER